MGYIDFTFNGTSARDMRIKSIRVDESIMHFPFATPANIGATRLPRSVETYMYSSTRENLVLPLQLMLVDKNGNPTEWKQKNIYEVADWLIQDGYKPLTLGDRTGIIYYAHLLESDMLAHYGNGGILPIQFVTNSPYGWSVPSMETFDLTENTSTTINLVNKSNVLEDYRPTLEIKNNKASGSIAIQNTTLNTPELKLTGLYVNEVISIDNERELIYTNKPLTNIGTRFNYQFLKLRRGENTIRVDGDCTITVRHQYPIIT